MRLEIGEIAVILVAVFGGGIDAKPESREGERVSGFLVASIDCGRRLGQAELLGRRRRGQGRHRDGNMERSPLMQHHEQDDGCHHRRAKELVQSSFGLVIHRVGWL